MNKNADAGTSPVRSRDMGTQSGTGMLLYGTEMQDVGTPMPMPSYESIGAQHCLFVNFNNVVRR